MDAGWLTRIRAIRRDIAVVEAAAPEVVEEEVAPLSVEDALKEVLKRALKHDGLARGLREAVKTLDRYARMRPM